MRDSVAAEVPGLPGGFNSRGEFPILRGWGFFNHAGVAPITARAAAALLQYGNEAAEDAYLTGRWYRKADGVREQCARLIGAEAGEIAFVKNTSEGLAFVANGLEWKAGDEIVSTNVEYPANVYPWMDVAQRFGVKHVMVKERTDGGVGRIEIEDIFAAVTGKTRMVALSHVEYASGFRNDLARIGKFCKDREILLTVDAIQSLGVLPVDVKGMGIDFLSADGHKWMLGPEGCGFFYCAREHLGKLRPEVGWMNVVNAQDYGNYDFTLRGDAKRFECGTLNIPGILALGASLGVLERVGLDLVWRRVDGLNRLLVAGLEHKGYRVFSSRAEGERSGIVTFTSGRFDHKTLVQGLEARRMIVALREGRVRVSAHFYNTTEQIQELVEALPGH